MFRYLRFYPCFRFALFLFLLAAALPKEAAAEARHLSKRNFQHHNCVVNLSNDEWLYQAGDDSAWADPDFPDEGWTLRTPRFLPSLADAGEYANIGWFRRHIIIDSTIFERTLYLTIGSYGAVEVFWDGSLVYSLGTVSADRATEKIFFREYSEPIPLETAGRAEHVIAVRFSHHHWQGYQRQQTSAGFNPAFQLGDQHGLPALQSRDFKTLGWSLVAGLSLALMVLHLSIYLLYPQVKENLYFGLFAGGVMLMAMTILGLWVLMTLSLEQHTLLLMVYRISLIVVILMAMRFMHKVSGALDRIQHNTKYTLALLGVGLLLAIFGTERMAYIAMLIVTAEVTRSLVHALIRKVERIWIIAIGFSALIFAGLLVALVNLGLMEWSPLKENISIGSIVALMLCISVYIGAKFAATNRTLASKIEEARRAVRALAESEDRYRSMVENPLAGVGIVDDKSRVLFVNDRWVEILGCRREDVVGHDVREPVVPESLDLVNQRLAGLMRGEERIITQEFDVLRGDGERRTVLCSASTYHTRRGLVHLVVHSTDVTEIREVERKRREALSLAEQTARMASIGVMAGGITHEINQPLNAIMLHAETLQFMAKNNRLDQTAPVHEALNHIVMGTERISEIIQHMRAFWIDGASPGHLERIDLNEPLLQGVHLTDQKIFAHAIQLKTDPAPEPLSVFANPLQLEQIVVNLLSNAVNSLDKTERRDKLITVRSFADNGQAVIEVTDNGVGLPTTDPDKLFDPFYSTGKEKGGTGLGLAIVRMFVDRFKGSVSAENNPSGGATFRVKLPRAETMNDAG